MAKNFIPDVLGRILQLAQSGDFDPNFSDGEQPFDPDSGEVVVGELTMFEKASRVVFHETKDRLQQAMLNPGDDANGDRKRIELLKGWLGIVKDVMWQSISERVNDQYYDRRQWAGLEIRADAKVVAMPNRRRLEAPDILAALLMGGPQGLGAIVEHDCANCEVYDRCDLPFKTARQQEGGSCAAHH